MEEKNPALELEVRGEIFKCLSKSPGLHFRELQRRTGLATGSLQYHIDYLKKKGLITEQKSWDYSRFYPTKELSEKEQEIMSSLRQKNVRKLLIFLLKNPGSNHGQIQKNLGLSPSTVSWYLKRSVESGILHQEKKGRQSHFYITDPETMIKILITYRESFLDKLLDMFIEGWQDD